MLRPMLCSKRDSVESVPAFSTLVSAPTDVFIEVSGVRNSCETIDNRSRSSRSLSSEREALSRSISYRRASLTAIAICCPIAVSRFTSASLKARCPKRPTNNTPITPPLNNKGTHATVFTCLPVRSKPGNLFAIVLRVSERTSSISTGA